MPDTQTCALRALSLCDGQVLEYERGALKFCLCRRVDAAAEMGAREFARRLMEERAELIARIPL